MTTTQRLKDLLGRATPGPWSTGWNDIPSNRLMAKESVVGPQKRGKDGKYLVGRLPFEFVFEWDFSRIVRKGSVEQQQAKADAELIAAARNALPALLAVVEAAAKVSEIWNGTHSSWDKDAVAVVNAQHAKAQADLAAALAALNTEKTNEKAT